MMSDQLQGLEDQILEYERRLKNSRENLKNDKIRYGDLVTKKKNLQESLDFIIEVDIKTRENLEIAVSQIASNALSSIFEDDPYQLETNFVPRRGQTECDISFKKEGQTHADPEFESGGGAINVASYALRISVMEIGKVLPVLVGDQPFKDLSKKHHEDFVEFFKNVSKEIGLQMIIISHLPEQIKSASKIFEIEKGKVINEFEADQRREGSKKRKRRRT